MASVVDDSVASVPLSELTRVRDGLLQEPEAKDVATADEANVATFSSDKNTKDEAAVVAASNAESANVYQSPYSSPKRLPRILTSKSASAADMAAMVDPSSSQEAFRTMTRAASFHGGDTQPMESQVYRDFNESMVRSTTTTPKKAVQQTSPGVNAYTYDTLGTDKTPHTYVEGDTGYVDLENALASPSAQSVFSHSDISSISSQTQYDREINNAPETTLPKTPGTAGHKRKRSDEIATSEITARKQPAFSQLFGAIQNGPMLSTTQLFAQTQAPSSPIPDGPQSDPVITRPSPNLFNRNTTSPPAAALSSPIAIMRPVSANGPRAHYTSTRESQERRLQVDIDEAILEDEQHEEEEQDFELRRFNEQRLRRVRSEGARQELAKFRVPSRRGVRPTTSPMVSEVVNIPTTPATAEKRDVEEFEGSEDGHDHYVAEDGGAQAVEDDEEGDDEYDELGQTVLRSQGLDEMYDDDDDLPADAEVVGIEDNVGDAVNAEEALLDTQLNVDEGDEHARVVTQQSAIADSQPTRQGDNQSVSANQPMGPPPMSSFVPGSQYVGRTSEDQVLHRSQLASASQRVLSPNHQLREAVSSSPALPEAAGPSRLRQIGGGTHSASQPVILESDLIEPDWDRTNSSHPATADANMLDCATDSNPFSTAQTHVSTPDPLRQRKDVQASPLKVLASQSGNVASQSPLAAAGVRRFADIAAAQSQSLSRGDSRESEVDVEVFMNDFVTAEDRQYLEAVSSPPQNRPQKRRKLDYEDMVATYSSPRKGATSELPAEQAVYIEEPAATIDESVIDLPAKTTDQARSLRLAQALQESPSKANEMPPTTQESIIEREKAGAKAVSQLVTARATKRQKPNLARRKKTGGGKKSISWREANETEHQAEVPAEYEETDSAGGHINQVPAEHAGEDAEVNDSVMHDNNAPRANEVNSANPQAQAVNAPDRVFALFKGNYNNFYPATWLSSSANGSIYRVKFDDTTVTSIEAQHVRRLELRIGDHVKVDAAGMRNKIWVVKGISRLAQSEDERAAGTDIYGRLAVQVEVKTTSTNSSGRTGKSDQTVDVTIPQIYLTHTLWTHFTKRDFSPTVDSATASEIVTPTSSAQMPRTETPPSKSRRTTSSGMNVVNGRSSHLREETFSNATSPTGVGIFSNMVFALSYGPNGGEKEEVARLIRRNGGIILENGFDELFELSNLGNSAPPSPSKGAPQAESDPHDNQAGLHLRTEYAASGFVALIADKHSRRAKYMQALALGLPTLSGKWIMHCLDPLHNTTLSSTEATPLRWMRYLLPAGESTYLDGAIRSRTLQPKFASEIRLNETIDKRDLLLNNDGVLIVAGKKGKVNQERIQTYAFLTLALGAGSVKRVSDLSEAKALVATKQDKWKWIYVDGSVTEASASLLGKGAGAGKKRKRGEDDVKLDATKMSVSDGNVTVVNDEFVVQSLIFGALVR